MKNLRQLHLYLGCIFAPLIIYFSLSGVWQVFRFNDLPKDDPSPSTARVLLHELSKPHTHSTFPGKDHKSEKSVVFNWVAAGMGLGLALTTMLGILIALRSSKRGIVVYCLTGGLVIPILLLLLKGN